MTRYAVTVAYTGDVFVDADSPEEAGDLVAKQLPNRTPDTDYYYTEITDVREEEE